MRQFFLIVRRGQGRGINGENPHVPGPFPVVIGKLAKQLPVVGRGVCDNLELSVVGCQEPEERRSGIKRQGVLTSQRFGSTISITNSLHARHVLRSST